MQTIPKFVGCKRSAFYVVKVFEVFEGHEVGKVNLISSTNSEKSPSCRLVDKKYMIAIADLKSKPVT